MATIFDKRQAKEFSDNGKFVRQKNRFTTPFGKGEGELPVEPNRYRLIWSPVCPWAHRSIIVRKLLGLEDVISVGTLDPIRPDTEKLDWAFTLDEGNVDPVLGIHFLSEAYKKADPEYDGRVTVPAVVDLTTGKVVNNDYFNLTRYWEIEWKEFHKEGAPDLYPEELRDQIDELNDILFHEINNGVYKAGFAKSQEAYDEAVNLVFHRLDWLEERLGHSRYLFGDQITESDIRLYVTLARFDIAYYNGFRVNKKMLKDYPNLWGYARDLYQQPGFGETTNFDAIKKHYHLCCLATNPNKILPVGPELDLWLTPHGRDKEYPSCLFTKKFGDGEDEWSVEPNRYRLLWMPACPHAHKVVIVRKLLGLDDVISLGTTGPLRTPDGWVFSEDEGEVDPVLKIHYLKDLYTREDPNYKGRPTVPIIADEKTGRGVNNDHFWLPIYLERDWKKYHKKGAPDLYPENLRDQIDELNYFIYRRINEGFYDLGFATTQEAYEKGYHALFEALDILDERLEHQRYLFGDTITDSDIRLFPSLARWDVVYYYQFRANKKSLRDYKNLWPYARDLYSIPAIRETTDFEFIKTSYQTSPHLKPLWGNHFGLRSKGPEVDSWNLPANRENIK